MKNTGRTDNNEEKKEKEADSILDQNLSRELLSNFKHLLYALPTEMRNKHNLFLSAQKVCTVFYTQNMEPLENARDQLQAQLKAYEEIDITTEQEAQLKIQIANLDRRLQPFQTEHQKLKKFATECEKQVKDLTKAQNDLCFLVLKNINKIDFQIGSNIIMGSSLFLHLCSYAITYNKAPFLNKVLSSLSQAQKEKIDLLNELDWTTLGGNKNAFSLICHAAVNQNCPDLLNNTFELLWKSISDEKLQRLLLTSQDFNYDESQTLLNLQPAILPLLLLLDAPTLKRFPYLEKVITLLNSHYDHFYDNENKNRFDLLKQMCGIDLYIEAITDCYKPKAALLIFKDIQNRNLNLEALYNKYPNNNVTILAKLCRFFFSSVWVIDRQFEYNNNQRPGVHKEQSVVYTLVIEAEKLKFTIDEVLFCIHKSFNNAIKNLENVIKKEENNKKILALLQTNKPELLIQLKELLKTEQAEKAKIKQQEEKSNKPDEEKQQTQENKKPKRKPR